jgi:hypothetical protein
MQFFSSFSMPQFLWSLTFAAQLVLLVVLLGRDRARHYLWFTTGIALYALRLMAEVLLVGRMPPFTLKCVFLSLGDVAAIVGLLVVVEVARRAFAGASRSLWIANTVGLLVVACGVLSVWGPWPVWAKLAWGTVLGQLQLMQLAAQKGDTLVQLLTLGVGLMVVLFGRRFKAAWRSHTQMIAIGLLAVAATWLGIQQTWLVIARTAHPQSQQEYEHILNLGNGLMNANKLVYIAALIWWIVWLWRDEPGTEKPQAAELAPTPEPEPEPEPEPKESPVEK